jgi:hypothetical protein
MRFRAEQCRHNIRQGETVRNVLLVVFMTAILPAPRSIASTNLFAEIDADAAIALDGRSHDAGCDRTGIGPLFRIFA